MAFNNQWPRAIVTAATQYARETLVSRFSRTAPTVCQALVFSSAGTRRVAVPTGMQRVVFSATSDFYVSVGASTVSAAVPSADATSSSELNPSAYDTGTSTHVSVAVGVASIVTMAFYPK